MSQIYTGGQGVTEEAEPTTFFQDLGEIVTSFVTATIDTVRAAISILPGVESDGKRSRARGHSSDDRLAGRLYSLAGRGF